MIIISPILNLEVALIRQEKMPTPDKITWLVELFKIKMNRLKDFLANN